MAAGDIVLKTVSSPSNIFLDLEAQGGGDPPVVITQALPYTWWFGSWIMFFILLFV